MKATRVYLCEDTQESIFTAVYDAGKSGYGHDHIRLQVQCKGQAQDLDLFAEYIEVGADEEKVEKVLRSVRNKISETVYHQILRAAGSNIPDKADVIYHYIVYGFAMGAAVENALQVPCVQRIFEINRSVANEAHYFREFLRFQEIRRENAVLLAVFEPNHRVLPLVAEHFADRLNPEWFIIYDKTYGEAVFHQPDGKWYIRVLEREECELLDEMEKEEEPYVRLFQTFFRSISISARENPSLQRNNLPLHYRKHMPEFHVDS